MRENERRGNERKLCYLDIVEPTTRSRLGHAWDISLKGINVVSRYKIPLTEEFLVSVESQESEDTIALVIRSVWSHFNEDPAFYRTGFEIINPSTETIRLLNELMESLGKTNKNKFKSTYHNILEQAPLAESYSAHKAVL